MRKVFELETGIEGTRIITPTAGLAIGGAAAAWLSGHIESARLALTVVLLVSVVGIVLVIALLTLPAAIAGQFTSTLRGMMALAALLSVTFTTAGLAVSYSPDLPAGATTIVIAGATYLAVLGSKRLLAAFR